MYMLDPSIHQHPQREANRSFLFPSRASGVVEGLAAEEELEGWRAGAKN